MLSFIREQGAGDPSASQTKAAGQRQSKTSEDAGSLEYLTVASNSKSVRKSTILVAILVCIGLICLGYMIRKSRPQTASGQPVNQEETKIEVAISRLTGVRSEMVSKMDQILKKFFEFSNVLQVQVSELVKNPFEVEMFASGGPSGTSSSDDVAQMVHTTTRQVVKQRAATLALLSVMQSDRGSSCMINDQLLREGDMIEGFVITRIGRDFELTWWTGNQPENDPPAETEDFKVLLKLSQ
jgi:preprotein translocase subunit SecG